jgi:sensor histidine kinase YesM
MQRYPFIFSAELKYRFWRHFLFWFAWWLFQVLIYGYMPVVTGVPLGEKILNSMVEGTFYLLPHMFMAYTLMYIVIPHFVVAGKYFYGAVAVIAITFLAAFFSSSISIYILNDLREHMFPNWGEILTRWRTNSVWLSLLAGLRGGITIGGMAAAIKLMKHWYLKEQRNLQLQKENSESELQLLKAQIHPHFLFNTLNNIYSHTQSTSPLASKLVMGLGDMLRYMLYECNQPMVPLEKELQLLDDYITLEKIRYGNSLDVHVDIPKDTGNLLVAPLLLLPFVENCFKHGTSHMLEQPWVSLHLALENKVMKMKLLNGKVPGYRFQKAGNGIGITNVRRRLDIIYPGKYTLDIKDEEEVFIVNLKLTLEKRKVTSVSHVMTLSTADA